MRHTVTLALLGSGVTGSWNAELRVALLVLPDPPTLCPSRHSSRLVQIRKHLLPYVALKLLF